MDTTMLLVEVGRVGTIPYHRATSIVAAVMSVEPSLAGFSLRSVLYIVHTG